MKIKEITNEELDALVKEGHDIVHAIIVQDKYTPRPTAQEEISRAMAQHRKRKKEWEPSEEEGERLYGMDIKRAYQIWYSQALAVVCKFLPLRSDDFKSFYEFPSKNRSELSGFNYRVADLLRGFGLPNKANWQICYSLIKAQCDILESVKAFLVSSKTSMQPKWPMDVHIAAEEIAVPAEKDNAKSRPSRKMESSRGDCEKLGKGKIDKSRSDRIRATTKESCYITSGEYNMSEEEVELLELMCNKTSTQTQTSKKPMK